MFASQFETDTLLFKRYYIILEFNIFKVTVETKTYDVELKSLRQTYFSSDFFFFKEDTYKPI